MSSLRPDSPSERDLTPAEANAELRRLAGELTPDEIERLATIADRADDEVADREMPEEEGWTADQREEVIAGWRRKRRWMARTAMRPGESGDDWRERLLAEGAVRHLVIPAQRAEDVVEVDLLTLRRRDRRRLFEPKSGKHARAHVLGVVRRASVGSARRTPTARPAARRPRRSGAGSRTSSSDPGDSSSGGDSDPPPPRLAVAPPRAIYSYGCLAAEQQREAAQ